MFEADKKWVRVLFERNTGTSKIRVFMQLESFKFRVKMLIIIKVEKSLFGQRSKNKYNQLKTWNSIVDVGK